MSIFGSRKDKGSSGNTGNASDGGWTLSGTSGGKRAAKAMRMEYTAPRKGDLAHRASRRPGQK
ncbi:hypothetical protein [Krasilnikovia sp. MM14-A1259]|uniref:hypothetical protein n=1 Tax=Krasilnikovia sp. MM14-A1259 TaxID=3373539 RepID=UPI0037F50555